jgi:hypothetical protein
MKKLIFFTAIPILFLTCAQRDNSFDPLSPLYRSSSPQLSVSIHYDSSKVTSVNNDTVVVHPPFTINIEASSSDSNFSILFRHFLNDTLINQSNSFSHMQIELTKSGSHQFDFQLSDNKVEYSEKHFRFLVLSSIPPQITSFKCSKDTLQIRTSQKVKFYTEIIDKDSLADSIYYVFSPFQVKSKALNKTENGVIRDTVDYEYNSIFEGIQKPVVFVIDKNKRKVSTSIDIVFLRYQRIVQNSHQIIDSIWANPANAYTGDMIEFKIKLTETSNHVYHYTWNFGDGYSSTEPYPIHRYSTAGIYNVKVVVENDSAFCAMDSLKIVITDHKNIPPQILSITTTPDSGIVLVPMKFSADAVDHDGIISRYYWSFGDSTSNITQTKEINHAYKNAGTYQVILIVQDNSMASDTLTDTVKVFQSH